MRAGQEAIEGLLSGGLCWQKQFHGQPQLVYGAESAEVLIIPSPITSSLRHLGRIYVSTDLGLIGGFL